MHEQLILKYLLIPKYKTIPGASLAHDSHEVESQPSHLILELLHLRHQLTDYVQHNSVRIMSQLIELVKVIGIRVI